MGLSRPDDSLAYPTLSGIEHAGFAGQVPVTGLSPGVHTLTVKISAGNEGQVEIEREFEVTPSENATGEALSTGSH